MNAPAAAIKQWLTAKDLAESGIPGLPSTERAIQLRAKRENWPSRERVGRGGGREYPLEALPAKARTAYVARHLATIEVPVPMQAEASREPEAMSLTDRAAEARDARLALLGLVERFIAESSAPKRIADQHFCDLYNAGSMDIASWIREQVKTLTPRTLFRWRQTRRAGRTARLGVDRAAARKGKGVLDTANGGEIKNFVLALLARQPHLTADHIRDIVSGRFEKGLELVSKDGEIRFVPVPPLRTFQHALRGWKVDYKVELTAISDPDGFKSKYRLTGRNSYSHVRHANQLWMIDASPADVLCLDGRHTIYVAIEVFTRRIIIYVTKTPRASAVGLLMRRAILAWGVPQLVKTDNGSDFVAHATKRLFASIDIDAETSTPFTPEEKAFVERAIGTVQRGAMRLLPGFIGHSVADRKVIEARKSFAARLGEDPNDAFCVELTAADLQRDVDAWVATKYDHSPHDGLDGRTPFAAAAACGEAIRTVDERALDVLLAPIAGRDGLRTVTKSGIRIDHRYYLAPHLMPETQVMVRMDPADLGRCMLFSPDGGEYLGEAICPAASGIDPRQAVKVAKEIQRDVIRERMAGARKEAKALTKGPRLVDYVLRARAKEAGKLVELPKPRVEHSTPQIAAALDAVQPASARTNTLRPDDAALHAEMVAQFEAELAGEKPQAPANVEAFPEQPKHRFRRAFDLEQRLEAGERIATDDALWLGGYRKSAEYLNHRELHEAFGDEWLFA